MKIYQVVTTLGYGDAVGNDIFALMDSMQKAGYQTKIFAEVIDKRISHKDVEKVEKMPELDAADIILYHLATGADLTFQIAKYPCRKILVYHNITPPRFFRRYNIQAAKNCEKGLAGVKFLADKVDYCLPVSTFNGEDLVRMGYRCKMDVQPILVKFDDYEKEPDCNLMEKMTDGYENIIFVGRIAPNKKQEDVIAVFAMYKKYYNPKSRLILAGSYGGMEKYLDCLKQYVEYNQVEDVIFTGHIRFEEILAYYRSAHIFLCMSEHEGFCVPLLEAMYFDIPIIAFDSTAVGDTLNGTGILLKEKDALLTAAWMNRISKDACLKEYLISKQRERLAFFANEKVQASFITRLREFIGD